MRIERVTRYRVNGQEFDSIAKAQDHIDGQVNKILQKALFDQKNNMFSVNDVIKITNAVLANRKTIAALLKVELPDEIADF